mmetsp:Transcript_6499/g.15417  ORF Transcript_6499/g.15417 Transcript_6499/m.15417 type:complete len:288 (+) Transcript_6499:37-900(+)
MPRVGRALRFICALVATSVPVEGAVTRQEQDDQCALQLSATAPPRVAIFMTTRWSTVHQQFMPCWETAGQQLSLIRDSDLILYTDANISGTDLERLHFRNIFIKHYQTPGKEAGATQAVIDGFGSKGHQEKWFDGYDWVRRVNPDVLIMNDAWLLEMMANPSVDAILADCFGLIHTDFFAVRPHVIDAKLAEGCSPSSPKYGKVNAEVHFTCITSPIISSGRYVWVKGVQHWKGACRVKGAESPVLHQHAFWKCCPDYLSPQANCSRDPEQDLLQLSSKANFTEQVS